MGSSSPLTPHPPPAPSSSTEEGVGMWTTSSWRWTPAGGSTSPLVSNVVFSHFYTFVSTFSTFSTFLLFLHFLLLPLQAGGVTSEGAGAGPASGTTRSGNSTCKAKPEVWVNIVGRKTLSLIVYKPYLLPYIMYNISDCALVPFIARWNH